MKKSYSIKDLSDLEKFARELVSQLKSGQHATVLTLSGNLGAGKTTLTQMIAQQLGVTEPVSSPTFVITKYYDLPDGSPTSIWSRLIHMDAYRLEGFSTEPLGLPELFSDPSNLIIIEWPNIIKKDLPKNCFSITIEQVNDTSRKILAKF